jgi:hypothetical protein
MGLGELLLSPFFLSNLEFPLELDLTICEISSHSNYLLSSPNFMDVDFPSDEAILEDKIMDFQPLPELETL